MTTTYTNQPECKMEYVLYMRIFYDRSFTCFAFILFPCVCERNIHSPVELKYLYSYELSWLHSTRNFMRHLYNEKNRQFHHNIHSFWHINCSDDTFQTTFLILACLRPNYRRKCEYLGKNNSNLHLFTKAINTKSTNFTNNFFLFFSYVAYEGGVVHFEWAENFDYGRSIN